MGVAAARLRACGHVRVGCGLEGSLSAFEVVRKTASGEVGMVLG